MEHISSAGDKPEGYMSTVDYIIMHNVGSTSKATILGAGFENLILNLVPMGFVLQDSQNRCT